MMAFPLWMYCSGDVYTHFPPNCGSAHSAGLLWVAPQ